MKKASVPCPFCGVGCKLDASSKKPLKEACARAYGVINYFSRNPVPEVLLYEDGLYNPIKLEEAIEIIVEWISKNRTYYIGSAEDTNESAFLLNLLARALGTNDVDHCGRVCHAPSIDAYWDIFGLPTTNFSLDDELNDSEVFIIGSDVAVTYPVFWSKIKREARKIIVIDSWTSFTMVQADEGIIIPPGPGYLALSELLYNYTYRREVPLWVQEWLDADTIEKTIHFWEDARAPVLVHGMGVTHSGYGYSILIRLLQAFLKRGGKIATLRGKVNVQGAGDMGLVPHLRRYFKTIEGIIKSEIPSRAGSDLVTAFKVDYPVYLIQCQNVIASLPNSEEVALKLLRSKVIQLTPKFTESSIFADLIIPTTPLVNSQGTVTSGDGRVTAFEIGENVAFRIYREVLEYFDVHFHDLREVTYTAFEIVPYYRNIDVYKLYNGYDQYIEKPRTWKEVTPPRVEIFHIHRDEGYWFYTTRDPALWTTKGADEILERNSMKKAFYVNPEEFSGCSKIKVCSPYTGVCVSGDVLHTKRVPRNVIVAFFNHVGLKVNSLIPFEPRDVRSGTPIYKSAKVKAFCVS
ncbi:hypothetical protein EYM_07315 [Ignicoccus islandicus DSM 13165]|uniref:Molybdopterin oxidoreductase domain-containing protein n=1 Tax=Ignicoccus islandicus DSM 13165 TaxID=940295 RepID=A0A0U3FTG3_9CREN|nr:molybdopterin-dependent oxidoreductase [Ignicoccus islandicus]ALU12768.1 hypothetical protein EYM_07315 [Ignicoccus islandicus DSM 13165]